VSKIISEDTLTRKIGQKILVGFCGTSLSDPWVQEVYQQAEQGLIGGVILFGRNIESPAQLKELANGFRKLETVLPLFVSVDQEGGKVQRLYPRSGFMDRDDQGAGAFVSFKSPKAVESDCKSFDEAKKYYSSFAQYVANFGFNLNFSPVVDLDPLSGPMCPIIGEIERSFGSDVKTVEKYAKAFIEAHHGAGVLTSLKHFPGHGTAKGDTHEGLIDVTQTWQERELEPFKSLIQKNMVDMIMTAHLVNAHWDKALPATLSPHVIQDILRKQLKYDGVVITDDLHMGAIYDNFGTQEATIRAIKAGNDILIFSNNPLAALKGSVEADVSLPHRIIEMVKESVSRGDISEEEIDHSYERIVKIKSRL
jgi:beta-N-acetylhexosaminidase